MTATAPMDLFTMPFESSPAKVEKILQACADHPWWFNAPATDEERMQSAAIVIHDPYNAVWEVWKGGVFVGIILLWHIQPRVDATVHFIFFDENLIGKRKLLLAFLGNCFDPEGMGFRRISIEVPEFAHAFLGFVRRKLGFRFEGEDLMADVLTPSGVKIKDPYRPGHRETAATVLASKASRREGAHWKDGTWYDVLCLRQTAEDYQRFVGEN